MNRRRVGGVAGVVVAGVLALAGCGGGAEPTPGPFLSGTYVVGQDIAPGDYSTAGERPFCGWQRLSDVAGSRVLDEGQVSGPATLHVEDSDGAVKLYGACEWTEAA